MPLDPVALQLGQPNCNSIVAVLLAAGSGKRLGGVSKARIPFRNSTLLEYAVQNLLDAGAGQVICCLREEDLDAFFASPFLSRFVASGRCQAVVPRPGFGLSESVQAAYLHVAHDGAKDTGILFHQVDRPLVAVGFLARLIQAFLQSRCAVISSCDGEWMPPAIVPLGLEHKLTELQGDQGLKKLFIANEFDFHVIDASREELFAFDVDTLADLSRLRNL